MHTRRGFLEKGIKAVVGLGTLAGSLGSGPRGLLAKAERIILSRDTKRESLIHYNPVQLDPRQLQITPLNAFGTMGPTDEDVNLKSWRLEISGEVETPLHLTYEQILGIPPVDRQVLLICPGVFANHGQWKGVSIGELLRRAGVREGVAYVDVRGPQGRYGKVGRYPMEDVISDKVFLAYGVNGQDLPRKHGFPLRIVAEDYYGYEWVKYVYQVRAVGGREGGADL